jgi:hypothetical protein
VGRRNDEARYPVRGVLSVFCAVAIVGVSSCKCAESVAAVDAGHAEKQREADLAVLPQAGGSLQNQLEAEAAARSKDTATLEGVIERATKAGVSFGPPRQAYGRKLIATYCGSVDSLDGMIVTVCEYPSAEQAKRGQAEGELINARIAGHQSRVHQKSVLFVVSRSDTPAESLAKVLSAFDAQ